MTKSHFSLGLFCLVSILIHMKQMNIIIKNKGEHKMTLTKLNHPGNGNIDPWNNVFNTLFNDTLLETRASVKAPAVNISESKTGYQIEVAAPGLRKEDFKINLEKNVLNVSAERKTENTEEDKQYSKREFSYQSFSRSFNLPDTIDSEAVEATYENGILSIQLSKREDQIKQKTIEVK